MKRADIVTNDAAIADWDGWNWLSEAQWENLEKAACMDRLVSLIEHDGLRAFAIYALSLANPKYWNMDSSSSGKYHPKHHNESWTLPDGSVVGGLMRHIWETMGMAVSGLHRYGYDPKQVGSLPNDRARMRDIVAFAVVLHDWAKNGNPISGWGKHTSPEHGEIASMTIRKELYPAFLEKFPEASEDVENLADMVKEACYAIKQHYGVWGGGRMKPSHEKLTDAAKILQEADYYGTRSFLGEFDAERMYHEIGSCSPSNPKWERRK